jgi:hypothetical protein
LIEPPSSEHRTADSSTAVQYSCAGNVIFGATLRKHEPGNQSRPQRRTLPNESGTKRGLADQRVSTSGACSSTGNCNGADRPTPNALVAGPFGFRHRRVSCSRVSNIAASSIGDPPLPESVRQGSRDSQTLSSRHVVSRYDTAPSSVAPMKQRSTSP